MIDVLLFIVLPYAATILCVVGTWYRIKHQSLTYTSLSSQFLERKGLLWGSVPWHIGITLIVLGHVLAFAAPQQWQYAMSHQSVLITVETIGLALSVLCLLGLLVLIVRRITSSRLQPVTTTMDLIVLALLLVQVGLGIATAVHYKWGAAWSAGVTSPYVWSLLTLRPDVSLIQDLPLIIKGHIVGAWLIVMVIPFSRLIHMFAVPLQYIARPPINVVWNNPRRFQVNSESFVHEEARRHFLKGGIGVALGFILLSAGTLDKAFRFFFGPRLSEEEETKLMEERLKRLEATTAQRKLELERQQKKFILISRLGDLKADEGKYFIDYSMQPAMAFKGADGLPLLISAKCTHLGCTVGNKANREGKILCPCHVSYFSIETGQPNPDAPAKAPLPHLGWVVMDTRGKVLATRTGAGKITGSIGGSDIAEARVYISKEEVIT